MDVSVPILSGQYEHGKPSNNIERFACFQQLAHSSID